MYDLYTSALHNWIEVIFSETRNFDWTNKNSQCTYVLSIKMILLIQVRKIILTIITVRWCNRSLYNVHCIVRQWRSPVQIDDLKYIPRKLNVVHVRNYKKQRYINTHTHRQTHANETKSAKKNIYKTTRLAKSNGIFHWIATETLSIVVHILLCVCLRVSV